MTQLTINGLRLLGRIHRNKAAFGIERLRYDCKGQFEEDREPADVADELVVHGYLDTYLEGRHRRWIRTEKPYTEKLRRKLAAYAQRHALRRKTKKDKAAVAKATEGVDPNVAKWFGYPTHAVMPVGRVHLLDDGGGE